MNKNMIVVRTQQRLRDGSTMPSFRLLPLDNTCPFLAAEYDVSNNQLVILHKDNKPDIEAMPKLDANGQPMQKNGNYLVERRQVVNYFESHLPETDSIVEFIQNVAVNADNITNYMPYLAKIEFKDPNQMQKPAIIATPDSIVNPAATIITN